MSESSTISQSASVAVIGAGYVGLTTAAYLAHLGHHVVCADIDADRIERLDRGEIPIVEAGLGELVAEGVGAGRLSFVVGAAVAAAGAEFVFLCVETPQGPDGSADLRHLEVASSQIAPVLRPGALVVNKSTVPVGSTRAVEAVLQRSDVAVVSNPEFLREGTAVHDCLHPDRVVIGATRRADGERLAALYAGLDAPVIITDTAVGRDHQVRGERLPGDEAVVHQRDRGDVRVGGRPHRRRHRGRRE